MVSCWEDLSGLPTILPPYPVLPAKHSQMEVGLQCLSGRCGKWSAEDPYERWNFYVQHAAPEQLAAPNGVQLFCRGAMQALVKDKWLGKDK